MLTVQINASRVIVNPPPLSPTSVARHPPSDQIASIIYAVLIKHKFIWESTEGCTQDNSIFPELPVALILAVIETFSMQD